MTRNTHDAAEVLRRAAANHGDHDLVSVPRWAATAGALACDEVDTIDTQLDELREEMTKERDDGEELAKGDRKDLYDEIADTLPSLRAILINIPEVDDADECLDLLSDAETLVHSITDTLKQLRNLG